LDPLVSFVQRGQVLENGRSSDRKCVKIGLNLLLEEAQALLWLGLRNAAKAFRETLRSCSK